MQHALCVCRRERAAQLQSERDGDRHREWRPTPQHRRERGSRHILAREVIATLMFPEVVGPYDVAMHDPARQLDLALEILESPGPLADERAAQQLHGDHGTALAVHGFDDRTARTSAEPRAHLIPPRNPAADRDAAGLERSTRPVGGHGGLLPPPHELDERLLFGEARQQGAEDGDERMHLPGPRSGDTGRDIALGGAFRSVDQRTHGARVRTSDHQREQECEHEPGTAGDEQELPKTTEGCEFLVAVSQHDESAHLRPGRRSQRLAERHEMRAPDGRVGTDRRFAQERVRKARIEVRGCGERADQRVHLPSRADCRRRQHGAAVRGPRE